MICIGVKYFEVLKTHSSEVPNFHQNTNIAMADRWDNKKLSTRRDMQAQKGQCWHPGNVIDGPRDPALRVQMRCIM